MSEEFGVYYGSPADFAPVNAAYLQLAEELQEQQVSDACDYIRYHYGNELSSLEMERVFEAFDIEYPLLPKWLKDKFDEFEIL